MKLATSLVLYVPIAMLGSKTQRDRQIPNRLTHSILILTIYSKSSSNVDGATNFDVFTSKSSQIRRRSANDPDKQGVEPRARAAPAD